MRPALEKLLQESMWLLAAMSDADKEKYRECVSGLRLAIRRAQTALTGQK